MVMLQGSDVAKNFRVIWSFHALSFIPNMTVAFKFQKPPDIPHLLKTKIQAKQAKTSKLKTRQKSSISKPAMKSVTLSSTSSAKSTTTAAAAAEEDHSCYYPGCRRDANCNCEICLASISATLDLMPISVQKSNLTKLSTASRRPSPRVEVTPISFDSQSSTPQSSTPLSRSPQTVPVSPDLRSCARVNPKENPGKKKIKKTERQRGFGSDFLRLILVLGLIFAAEYGFSWAVSEVLKPTISPDTVRKIGEKSLAVKDLKGRLRFLEKNFQGLINGKISNCSCANSRWEISKDRLILSSHCKLYKSSMEEVRIWGWPLQTSGLLATGCSLRSFTVISGRVTEWSDGRVSYVIRKTNSSWTHLKWESSAVQFDANTWILEYKRSSVLENPRLVSATLAFLKYRMSRILSQIKQDLWLLSFFKSIQNYYSFSVTNNVQVPT